MAAFCPQTLHNIPCHIPDCPSDHKLKVCIPCAALCGSPANYNSHIESPKHQQSLRAVAANACDPRPLWCSLCESSFPGDAAWDEHLVTVHESAARKAGHGDKDPFVWPVDLSMPNTYRCPFCRKSVAYACMDLHLRGAAHIVRQRAVLGLAEMTRAERAYGVLVHELDTGVDFGHVGAEEGAKGKSLVVTVMNVSGEETLHVVRAQVVSPFTASVPEHSQAIWPGTSGEVHVLFTHDQVGIFEGQLGITLQRGSQDPLTVIRKVIAVVKHSALPSHPPAQKAMECLMIPPPSNQRDDMSGQATEDDSESARPQCTCQRAAAAYRSVGVQAC